MKGKKKLLSIKIIILIIIPLYSYEIKEYEKELVKYIPSDGRIQSLKYGKGVLPPGPECFTISDNNFIYVCDTHNDRIVVFDINMNYIKEIKHNEKKRYFSFANNLKIDNIENLYLTSNNGLLTKFDNKGNKFFRIFDINKENYIINNFIFYYDGNKKIHAIDETGNILDNTTAKEKLKKEKIKKNENNSTNDIQIEIFVEENELILLDGKLLINDFSVHQKYYKIRKNQSVKKNNSEEEINLANFRVYKIFGYDNNINCYWGAYYGEGIKQREVVLVFNKNGLLINIFYNTINGLDLQVAPNGDLYGMVLGDGGVSFYKITRKW